MYLSVNLTLKPGSSDSFKIGSKTSTPVGVLLTTAPLQIPERVWLAASVTESLATAVTVLKIGSPVVPGFVYVMMSPILSWLLKSAIAADVIVFPPVILNAVPSLNTFFLTLH